MNQDPAPQPAQARPTGEELERLVLKGLLLIFLAAMVYIPAVAGGYIYDDDTLLTQNPVLTSGSGFLDGRSWRGLALIWFPWGDPVAETAVPDYAPVSTTTLWAEWHFWGVDHPGAYHSTNIALHIAGALLLWAVLARMRLPGAWVAALVWAVHPVGVESVAWIAERRNVLAMPLLMAALLAWLRFQESRRRWDYVLAVVLFAVTLLAKSTAVMLPFFLLLWIWWKRDRVTKRDLAGTAPFFALSLALGLVTAWFQYARAIADEQMPIGGLPHRVASACFALGVYVWNVALPLRLMFNYPEWHKSMGAGLQALPIVPFIAVFAWAWRERATWGRHVILGLGFFVIMIAPALGVMKMAYMRITLLADHFEYMPMAGLVALAVVGGVWLRDLWKASPVRYGVDAVSVCAILLFSVLTVQRAYVFQKPERLWNDTLDKNPDAWQAHEHLGGILYDSGDLRGALPHFKRGVELRPYLGETHNNYGNTLWRLGLNPDEALEENRKAAELVPKNVATQYSYAVALESAKRPGEAVVQYRKVRELNGPNAMISCKIGELLMQTGNTGEAIDSFKEALRLQPDAAIARRDLDHALQVQEKERQR